MHTKGGSSGVVQNNFMIEKEKELEKNEFELFCERMTCHGFADFYQARHVWEKIFWAAAIMLATSFFVFQAFVEVTEYIHNPILTSISIETKSELPFPPVYICPMNYPDWKMLGIDGCKQHNFVNLTSFLQPRSGGILKGTTSRWLEIATTLEAPFVGEGDIATPNYKCKTMEDNITIAEYIKWYAMSTDMFIRECSFESTSIDCSKVVTQVLDKEYGVCYLVEVAQGKAMQRIPGNGLNLMLDIQTELLEFQPHNYTPASVDGVYIRIGKMDPAELGGSLLGPGLVSLILASRKQKLMSYAMGSTPQMCNPTTGRYEVFNGTQVKYSEQLCSADCGLSTIVRTCNCVTPFDHRFLKLQVGQLNFCTAEDYDNCIAPNFKNREVLSDVHACSEKCYPACEKAEIAISLSNAKFPSVGLLKKLTKPEGLMNNNPDYDAFPKAEKRKKRNVIDQPENNCRNGPHQPSFCGSIDFSKSERWSDNMMIVEIAFDELQYTLIEQGPSRTLTSLVSNIGGQAGLWIGASIFTFIQLLVYCVRICCSHN